jgi:hypothetical protein
MTVSRRTALGVLTRARLPEVAAQAGHDGLTGRRKEEIVEALASSRRAALAELLAHSSRDERKSACEAAGLSTKGREKAFIVDRLLGNGAADLPLRALVDVPQWPPGPPEPGRTYFWRVDEESGAGVRRGRTWRFTADG